MTSPATSRAQALTRGLARYLSGKPCPQGHTAYRYAINGTCVSCHYQRSRARIEANRDRQRKYARESARRVRAADPEASRTRSRLEGAKWSTRNRTRRRELDRAAYRRNPARYVARARTAKCSKRNRTPAWADLGEISKIYEKARALAKSSGLSWHVDHIVPLNGRFVSGLHVPENLQLLLGGENARKSNRFAP